MELEQPSEYDITLTNPSTFYENLNSLNDRMSFILDIFNNAYVNYNMAPSVQEYQTALLNVTNNIISTNGSLFTLSNDIESSINLINKDLTDIDKKIQKEKKLNQTLKKKSSSDTDKINASTQLIDEYKEIYKLKYLNNFNILIGIIIGIFMCKKIFK
jgi:hypothetical protein